MSITELNHQHVCILGYGAEGKSTYAALKRYAPEAKVAIADGDPRATGESGVPLLNGPDYLDRLSDFDVIIKSPGIAWYPKGKLADKLTSATEIFLGSLPEGIQVVGITGTKGKSSTSSFIHQALVAGGKRAFLAGNIGKPMLDYLPEATPGTIFVLELSSYQLESLHTSPHVAVLTSFFPDHLDRHGSLEAYHQAKQRIARFQTSRDIIFYNEAFPACRAIAELSPGRKVPFGPQDFPGELEGKAAATTANYAAAYLVAVHLGVERHAAQTALEHATSLPHRQQSLGIHAGVEWINDSAASTPESTEAALEVFGRHTDSIIVGGLDRGYDFTSLGQKLAASDIAHVILFPDTGQRIRQAIAAAHPHVAKHYYETSSMEQAVNYALGHTRPGRICLLSNGSPSYNLFKNFPDRGRAFQEAVEALDTPAA